MCWTPSATYTRKLALALNVVGLANIQFAIQRGKVFVIEVNPRASRTVPYVSKATGVPLAKIASRLMTGRTLKELLPEEVASGTDLSTGAHLLCEVAGVSVGQVPRRGHGAGAGDEVHRRGDGRGATTSARPLPRRSSRRARCCRLKGTVFLSVNDHDKEAVVALARRFVEMGFNLVATHGTAEVLEARGPAAWSGCSR